MLGQRSYIQPNFADRQQAKSLSQFFTSSVLPFLLFQLNRCLLFLLCRETLDSKKGSDTSSQASARTRKSQDAAVGALVHMLRTAPPLRQDSSCYTSRSVKTEVEGETGTASGFYVPRKALDALEELKTYTQLKDMLLSKSTTRSGSEGGTQCDVHIYLLLRGSLTSIYCGED